jgi:hypothetical protein
MSKTIHRSQKHAKCRLDFGVKYKCNKEFCAGNGQIPKWIAAREKRDESKKIKSTELQDTF